MMRLTAAAAAAPVLLPGCASFSPDGGADKVSELTKERTGQAVALQRTASETDSASARLSSASCSGSGGSAIWCCASNLRTPRGSASR